MIRLEKNEIIFFILQIYKTNDYKHGCREVIDDFYGN